MIAGCRKLLVLLVLAGQLIAVLPGLAAASSGCGKQLQEVAGEIPAPIAHEDHSTHQMAGGAQKAFSEALETDDCVSDCNPATGDCCTGAIPGSFPPSLPVPGSPPAGDYLFSPQLIQTGVLLPPPIRC